MTYISNDKMDKYDFLMGAFIGVFSGLLDVFFVGKPGEGMLGKWVDQKTNECVIRYAEAKSEKKFTGDNALQHAIQYLERNAKVPYDQAKSVDVDGMVKHMTPKNHHLKSLAHSPDPIGLCCAILDQFQMKATFIDNGKIIRVNSSGAELVGDNFVAKVYAGAGNWFMHLMSDVAGSNSAVGRGSGLPIPFYELFGLCNFGEFGQHRQTLATVMVQVFEKGYDLRHGVAMAIPLLVGNLVTMMAWSFKRRLYHNWDWKHCIPSDDYKSYRRMQLVNNGAFCLVDGVDSYIRGKGNPVEIILRMNLFAWLRLVQLIIKELLITYGKSYEDLVNDLNEVNKSLDEELAKLKSYDYKAWEEENELTKDFNKLILGKDNFEIGSLALDYVFSHNVKLNYSNFEEFSELFRNNKALF